MRLPPALCLLVSLVFCNMAAAAQAASSEQPKSVAVPATVDHNRVVIEVDILFPDNTWQNVRAWVDNGNPDLEMSRHLATQLGLAMTCNDEECSSASPPREIAIGGMVVPLSGVTEAKIPLRPVAAAAVLASGMNVEINLPASVLRHYDVLIDFPGHKFSIGAPGTIHFQGTSSKAQIAAANGLIQVPSQIEKRKLNLALDIGSCMSMLSEEVFDTLANAHPDWPHMTGAVGPANMWGADAETASKVMRLDRLQYGALFLTNAAFVSLPKGTVDFFSKRAGIPTGGVVGSNLLLNYRVGLDYVHSTVYFDIGRTFTFPDFDVVGLVLRPEDDGRYTILGVADFEGAPSIPGGADGVQVGDHLVGVGGIPVRGSTMGQVWSMLGGTPGQERKLTIERGGKEFVVGATVRHFLGEAPESQKKRR